ncbi:uncharacterized protein ACRADG_003274 [Cochliomyia hominivorax]
MWRTHCPPATSQSPSTPPSTHLNDYHYDNNDVDDDVEHRDKEIYKTCPDYPDNFIDQFGAEPSNVTILDDYSYYVHGDVEILYDFDPKKIYKASVEFFKKERGIWQKSVCTLKRVDFCKALFDTSEIWNSVVKNIPQQQRKCPLEKGQIFSFDFTTEPTFEMSSGSLDGEYWA